MKLTQIQKDLLFGTLLGDGNLFTETHGRSWRYRAIHKSEHKDYLFHKYEILKPLCGTAPTQSFPFDERTKRTYQRWTFNTLQQSSLKFYGDMFYTFDPKNQTWYKDVPLKVETFLTPRALAYFYMDDGALKWRGRSNAMRICTESFSTEGNFRLQNALQNKYGIETNRVKKTFRDGTFNYRISIPERSSEAFRKLISPYLVDCMKYKVSDGDRGNL